MSDPKPQSVIQASTADPDISDSSQSKHDPPVAVIAAPQEASENETPADQIDGKKKSFWAYFQTKEFYITLLLGWVSPVDRSGEI